MSRHVINLTAGTTDNRINEIKAAIETYASEFFTVDSDTGSTTSRLVVFSTVNGRKLSLSYAGANQIWVRIRNIADTGFIGISLMQTSTSVNTQTMFIAKNSDSCVINWVITNSGNVYDECVFIGRVGDTANYILVAVGGNQSSWSQYNLTDDTAIPSPLNQIGIPSVWARKTETGKQLILPMFSHSNDKVTLYDKPISKVFIFPNLDNIGITNLVTIDSKNYHVFGKLGATTTFIGLIEV